MHKDIINTLRSLMIIAEQKSGEHLADFQKFHDQEDEMKAYHYADLANRIYDWILNK